MSNIYIIQSSIISGLGKGVISGCLLKILKETGRNVNILKIDPYLNLSAGFLGPSQHGEVYVTKKGYEGDLDLGTYERFSGKNMSSNNLITQGRVLKKIIKNQENGIYHGDTIKYDPHMTNIYLDYINRALNGYDDLIIEIGGSVDDEESTIIYRHVLRNLMTTHNVTIVNVTKIITELGEYKTKPIQNGLKILQTYGIPKVDYILIRSVEPIPSEDMKKIKTKLPNNAKIINVYNVKNIYTDLQPILQKHFTKVTQIPTEIMFSKEVKIGICGKYNDCVDSYKSIKDQLMLTGLKLGIDVTVINVDGLDTSSDISGIVIAPGFGNRYFESLVEVSNKIIEKEFPCLGICLGFQVNLINIIRKYLNFHANSEEVNTENAVITKLDKMMLGEIEGKRYRNRYGFKNNFVNSEIIKSLKKMGIKLNFVNNVLVEYEWFDKKNLGVQYHPEFNTVQDESLFRFFSLFI